MGLGVLVALAALVGQPAVGPGLGLQFASIKPLERSSVVELDAPVTGQRNAIDERGGVNGGSVPELGLVDDKPQQGQDDAWRHDAFTRGNDLLRRTDGGEGQVLFGKVIRTNRLVECGLIFAIVLSGYGAAFALGWGLFGGERLQPLWIAIGSAGPVVMLLAVICLVSGKVWVPW